MSYNPKLGDSVETLDTPAMLIDLDLMESNIQKLLYRLKQVNSNIKIRPHFKTIKSPILANLLLKTDPAFVGGCVAKISEAEVMVKAGIEDLLITTEIIGTPKVNRLIQLFQTQPKIKVVVDSLIGATALNKAVLEMWSRFDEKPDNTVQANNLQPLQVLIDVNVGQNRTGISTINEVIALARQLSQLSGLRLIGLQGYEGHLQHLHSENERAEQCRVAMEKLVSIVEQLRVEGFNIETVTTGGTGTAEICASCPGITEVQPGSFIFMDTDYRNALGSVYSNALTILSTVLSRSEERHAVVIDAGLKSLSTDSGMAELKGTGSTKISYRPGGDEHGILEWSGKLENNELAIGDRVEMIPSHIDTTINLHDFYYAHRQNVLEAIWPVEARGKVQ